MVFSTYEDIRIAAIAASVPEHVLKAEDEISDQGENARLLSQFSKKTGIKEKHVSGFDQTASDFAYSAAKQIMDAGYYKPEEVGVLINLTQTPDYRTPSTALILQKRLNLSNDCLAFDVNLGCSAFVYGISLAASLLKTSTATKALVTLGDTLARGRIKGRKYSSNTVFLFGDASAAILVEKAEEQTLCSALMSNGRGHKALSNPYNCWRHPVGPENFPGDDIAVFNFTINDVPDLIKAYLEKTRTQMEDYDALILHQANMMILKNLAKRVGMPMEKVPISLDRFGNTSGCSVPLTIVDKYGDDAEDREVNLLTSAFGIGLSWGVIGFKINTRDVLPLTIGKDTFDDGYSDDLEPDEYFIRATDK